MNLSNISLVAKLWSAILVVIALLLTTLITATMISTNLTNRQDVVATAHVAKVAEIANWVGLTKTNVTRVTAAVVSSDPAVDELFKDQIPAAIQEISAIQKKIDAMDLSTGSKALFARIGEERQAVLGSLAKARDAKKAGNQAAALSEVNGVFLPAVNKYVNSLNELSAMQVKEYDVLRETFVVQRDNAGNFARVMVAGLVVILLVGTWILLRQIRQPLREAIGVAETIAGGDLSQSVNVDRGDEFGEMMCALARMKEQLVRLVADVRSGSESVATASAEIAQGNNDLSARTEQQASALEETASSMEELSATVKQNADSARQANQLALNASAVAVKGGDVVGQVVQTMKGINESSRKIADIISVIDGIAFQTNILALNAAVEAARAGEQGRGFAVVASEVRSLAGRSAEAAKEIKSLIGASVERVEQGTTLVDQAGTTMTEVVNSIRRVTDLMAEISAASSEQASGVAQVGQAVQQMDQATQQNAALVEQMAAAAGSLKSQADDLVQVVATFKLDPASHGPRPAKVSARAPTATAVRLAAPPRRAAGAPALAAKSNAGRPPARATSLTGPAAAAKGNPPGADGEWESF